MIPSTRKNSRFLCRKFPVLRLGKHGRTGAIPWGLRPRTSQESRRKRKIPGSFPCSREFPRRRPVSRDRVRHQAVLRKWHDFPAFRIARHFRRLAGEISVCTRLPTVSGAHCGREWPKVSGRQIPFPRMVFLVDPRGCGTPAKTQVQSRSIRPSGRAKSGVEFGFARGLAGRD